MIYIESAFYSIQEHPILTWSSYQIYRTNWNLSSYRSSAESQLATGDYMSGSEYALKMFYEYLHQKRYINKSIGPFLQFSDSITTPFVSHFIEQ